MHIHHHWSTDDFCACGEHLPSIAAPPLWTDLANEVLHCTSGQAPWLFLEDLHFRLGWLLGSFSLSLGALLLLRAIGLSLTLSRVFWSCGTGDWGIGVCQVV